MTGRETPKYPTLTGKVSSKHEVFLSFFFFFFKKTVFTARNNELHMVLTFSWTLHLLNRVFFFERACLIRKMLHNIIYQISHVYN